MTPTHHPLCNDVLKRPPDAAPEDCGDLPIYRMTEDIIASFWQPDEEELAALSNGQPVVLLAWSSTHPPVNVQVLKHQAVDTKLPETDAEIEQFLADLDAGKIQTPKAPSPALMVWLVRQHETIKRLRSKLRDCINRMETIRETHPVISLDWDIKMAEAVLIATDPDHAG